MSPKTGKARLLLHWAIAAVLGALWIVTSQAAALDEPIKPLPAKLKLDSAKVELGRSLFNDKHLSGNGTTSCATCHVLEKGGVDHMAHSLGFTGKQTGVNAPTVLNAALNFRQFWDGRAATLEDQVEAVVQNPVEMGSKWDDVVAFLSSDSGYSKAFASAYNDGVSKTNVMNAIATYERSLVTPSRFDRYLLGEADAINAQEKAGYERFKHYGCIACHQGINVGGNMYQRFGVMGDYFKVRGNETPADLGRYNVTKNEADKHMFKVPTLRNVALTAPYFHDGSATTLEDAVDVMFKYQLGRLGPKEDKELIIKFLNALTDESRGAGK